MSDDLNQRTKITMSTPTQAILEEDGTERTLVAIAAKVSEAEAVIRELLQREPARDWSIRELQDEAALTDDLSPASISIAFLRLRDAGVLGMDSHLRVRAA
jgi:hypothetical protein